MTATVTDVRLLDRARKQLTDEIDAKGEQIAHGLAADFADYRYRCGEIAGMRTALGMLGEIIKSMGDNRS